MKWNFIIFVVPNISLKSETPVLMCTRTWEENNLCINTFFHAAYTKPKLLIKLI